MILACEHHDAVLHHWRRLELTGVSLAHLDFHDDLRGLLIHRRRQIAYPIGGLARRESPVDPGNFLAHAVLEGRLAEVDWVHDVVGGRAWDMGIARYERDLFSLHHRLRRAFAGGPVYPLRFSETLLAAWNGVRPGQLLSIDWDCFASILQDTDGVAARVEMFMTRLGDVTPLHTYVCYSTEYSRPTLEQFHQLVESLSKRYQQPVEWLSPGLQHGELHPTDVDAGLPTAISKRAILFLRRCGIF